MLPHAIKGIYSRTHTHTRTNKSRRVQINGDGKTMNRKLFARKSTDQWRIDIQSKWIARTLYFFHISILILSIKLMFDFMFNQSKREDKTLFKMFVIWFGKQFSHEIYLHILLLISHGRFQNIKHILILFFPVLCRLHFVYLASLCVCFTLFISFWLKLNKIIILSAILPLINLMESYCVVSCLIDDD